MRILIFFIALFLCTSSWSQAYRELPALKKTALNVYYSKGFEQRALSISTRLMGAYQYHRQLLNFTPSGDVLVLSKNDWKKYTTLPMVYGMPHYNDDSTLIVAAEDNEFWRSFLPPADQLPENIRAQVISAYQDKNGQLTMQPFFDLLAIHELGHMFHFQAGLTMQRKWMGELYTNILLHTYIAENEPHLLPALTVFPKMVVAGGTKEFRFTSLKDVEEKYDEIGLNHPKNYGWYQCRWHYAAAEIYDRSGKKTGTALWNALRSKKEKLNDEDLMKFLQSIDPAVAGVMINWERDMIR